MGNDMKQNAILVIASLLMTYCIFESVFVLIGVSPYQRGRVGAFQWIAQDPMRGWVNRPRFKHDEFSIDERGFRIVAPIRDARETIVCMGDSGTFGTWDDGAWPRFPDYPSVLQQLVDPASFRVLNAGVIGYTSSHLLRQYMLQVRKLEPSLIIVRVGFNDHSPAVDVRQSVHEPAEAWKRFLIYKMGTTFTVQTAMKLRLAWKDPTRGQEPWNNLEQFRHNLEALITNARKDKVRVILVDYPIRPLHFPARIEGKKFPEEIWGVKNHSELLDLHRAYEEEIYAIADRLGVTLVRTRRVLEDQNKSGFTGTDIVHPAPEGYRLIAEALAIEINEGRNAPQSNR